MRLTLKGRIVVAVLFLILFGGAGVHLYSRYTGLTLGQMWHQLTMPSTQKAEEKVAPNSDAEIKTRLLEALFSRPELRKQNIAFAVSGGVVTFSGEVDAPQHQAALEQVGQQIPGVNQVVNNVTVKTPLSNGTTGQVTNLNPDKELAEKVEFALYQTDAFDLKLMTIIARAGRVQLSGNVRSVAEKLLAERIAREVDGVTEVINELTVQSSG
jgi:osmotically-inducible protein OsmY